MLLSSNFFGKRLSFYIFLESKRNNSRNTIGAQWWGGDTYVLDDFEGPDVGELCGDELPQRRLLRLQPLAQLAVALHDVRPVVLEAVQRLLHLWILSIIRNTNETSQRLVSSSNTNADVDVPHHVLGGVWDAGCGGEVVELGDAEAGVVVQLHHEALHLLVLSREMLHTHYTRAGNEEPQSFYIHGED